MLIDSYIEGDRTAVSHKIDRNSYLNSDIVLTSKNHMSPHMMKFDFFKNKYNIGDLIVRDDMKKFFRSLNITVKDVVSNSSIIITESKRSTKKYNQGAINSLPVMDTDTYFYYLNQIINASASYIYYSCTYNDKSTVKHQVKDINSKDFSQFEYINNIENLNTLNYIEPIVNEKEVKPKKSLDKELDEIDKNLDKILDEDFDLDFF